MKQNMVGRIFNMSKKFNKFPFISKFLWIINRIIFACDIPYSADIHPSVYFFHNGLGVVVHVKAKIGMNTIILQNVTIAGNMGKKRIYNGKEISSPIIGRNVTIGAGASIIGPIVIGDNVQIGSGAVVTKDIPDNSVAVGIPAKVIKVLSEKVHQE